MIYPEIEIEFINIVYNNINNEYKEFISYSFIINDIQTKKSSFLYYLNKIANLIKSFIFL